MDAPALAPAAPARSRPVRAARRAVRRGVPLLLTLALAACWAVFLRPVALGGPASYVVVSGHSMEPTLRPGALVVAFRRAAYHPGDVVVYRVPRGEPGAGALVIHRLVGGSAGQGFVLCGDNKDGPDPWRPTADDVLGEARLAVPHLGTALARFHSPAGVALLAGLTTLLVALAPPRRRGRGA